MAFFCSAVSSGGSDCFSLGDGIRVGINVRIAGILELEPRDTVLVSSDRVGMSDGLDMVLTFDFGSDGFSRGEGEKEIRGPLCWLFIEWSSFRNSAVGSNLLLCGTLSEILPLGKELDDFKDFDDAFRRTSDVRNVGMKLWLDVAM
jgi:hypothetical protein